MERKRWMILLVFICLFSFSCGRDYGKEKMDDIVGVYLLQVSQVFFVGLKAGDERKAAAEETMLAYKDIAQADLASTCPIRLGLALNFSVFYYEILNSSEKAYSMAKQAFEEAIAELDTLGEESYMDSTLIMQLLIILQVRSASSLCPLFIL